MRKAKELNNDNDIYKVALLVSLACVLQICESLIPHPIPGLRLGLANAITLIALVNLGLGYALEITILRTILSSFVMGSFMSFGFILSFSGGIISTLIMGLLYYWPARFYKHYPLTIIGISVVGALSHNLVQLYLAYLILVRHSGIFVFLPWLGIGAVIMGWVTGVAAGRVCSKLKESEERRVMAQALERDYANLALSHYSPGTSFIHRLPAQIKIASIFILSLVVIALNNFWLCLGLFLLLSVIAVVSQTSLTLLFLRAKRYTSLVFVSFLFPVFFNSGKHILSHIAYFKITSEGLNTGALFAWRIIFLILASSLLARTTSPKELTDGLAKILSPLRPMGISGRRTAAILSLSWMAIPVFWEMAKDIIRQAELRKAKNLCNLISLLSDFITRLYLETEQITTIWDDAYFSPTFLRKEVKWP